MFELFFRTLWRAVLNSGPVKPKHKQIFKKACQRVQMNNSKILKRSGYLRYLLLIFSRQNFEFWILLFSLGGDFVIHLTSLSVCLWVCTKVMLKQEDGHNDYADTFSAPWQFRIWWEKNLESHIHTGDYLNLCPDSDLIKNWSNPGSSS